MNLSVIISTYERPDYLEKVLLGYAVQTRPADEIVVADDGSGPATAALLARLGAERGLPIVHVRHEDHGFRKSLIMNRAILASTGTYLLVTDGDCIPRQDLLAVHERLARPGRFVAGGYLKLPAGVSTAITPDHVLDGRATDLGWLRAAGWRPGRRALRLAGGWRVGTLLDALTPTRAEFQGNNASAWRDDLFAVNGFENAMGYGGLDKALGRRLRNLGLRGIQARHRAVCLHLHHERPYRRPDQMRANQELLRRIRRERLVRAGSGLAELRAEEGDG
jgi:glycosyltransferase involved in cell wall biosynthesis